MATKNITVAEDAYELLKAHKRDDESFSDTIRRLTEGADVMEYAGSCSGLAETAEAARSELEDDLEEKGNELFGQ
ncbi:antitoxin VapB family protein [Haladaptatus sp. F3-133]|uniref:Antitoxin VapB family protein n=1 Tax=Halorutilus salinus TaxID=2487751 RepID=A0A9Q4GFJ4_9EURY|nr:antitoxin VapB family protein [Halorutilus salinus]MCX2818209.1 antitoxin VapB family protein [Halorutilus salinus]